MWGNGSAQRRRVRVLQVPSHLDQDLIECMTDQTDCGYLKQTCLSIWLTNWLTGEGTIKRHKAENRRDVACNIKAAGSCGRFVWFFSCHMTAAATTTASEQRRVKKKWLGDFVATGSWRCTGNVICSFSFCLILFFTACIQICLFFCRCCCARWVAVWVEVFYINLNRLLKSRTVTWRHFVWTSQRSTLTRLL